ncbi:carboxylesterase/lipase family protein [Ramlibacter henchirensis]|nr:carboxylesterase family protein [Ramlibacter henchirensis]
MREDSTVQLPCGLLRGARVPVPGGAQVLRFTAIPYAAAPAGPLRWRPPQPAPAWIGVRDATQFGPDLPQVPGPLIRGNGQSEDALHLNVWTPDLQPRQPLPVIVWLHGGGFVSGSGTDPRADGARLCAEGAVVVNVSYRTGLFGFLAHPALSGESPQRTSGNYGLLDQLAALRWVRDNIAAFGGDAARVTLAGVSAGSASISLFLTSPQARGLFDRAILHSPGAGRPLATLEDAERAGRELGDDIEALRALDAAALLEKTGMLTPKVRGLTTPRVLRPIVDGWLLPLQDREAFRIGAFTRLPIIVGSNLDEGSMLTRDWPVRDLASYGDLVRRNFGEAASQVMALYPARTDADVRGRVAELFADTQFNYGTRLIAQSMAGRGQPTFRYLFLRRRPGRADGPQHGEEVAHVFGNFGTNPVDALDEQLSSVLRRTWVRFAATGDPNGGGAPRWEPYDPAADNHLAFGDTIAPGRAWRAAQLDFLEHYCG